MGNLLNKARQTHHGSIAPVRGGYGLYIVCSIHTTVNNLLQIFFGSMDGKGLMSTVYLISWIRCNNIHIKILLHLIREIRYAVLTESNEQGP
jgi:hypothetical protein